MCNLINTHTHTHTHTPVLVQIGAVRYLYRFEHTHTHTHLESNKEAGGGAQDAQGSSKSCTSIESVSPSVAPDQRFS